MFTKCVFAVVLLAVVFATYAPSQAYVYRGSHQYAAAPNNNHNMTAGSRVPGDRITHQEYVVKSSALWQVTTIEKRFSAAPYEKITQVVAIDQALNGTGAYAKIVKGGPGYNNVTMKFTSQRNHGIKFLVQIFSRR